MKNIKHIFLFFPLKSWLDMAHWHCQLKSSSYIKKTKMSEEHKSSLKKIKKRGKNRANTDSEYFPGFLKIWNKNDC